MIQAKIKAMRLPMVRTVSYAERGFLQGVRRLRVFYAKAQQKNKNLHAQSTVSLVFCLHI